ncbi:MAG: hypothetical protein ACFCAD_11065 [Pleurocapsa sp.]
MSFYLIQIPLLLFLGTGYSSIVLSNELFLYSIGREPFTISDRDNYPEYIEQFSDNGITQTIQALKESFLGVSRMLFDKIILSCAKQKVENIRWEWINNKVKISIVMNNQSFGIDKYLPESEKRFLYTLLREWLDQKQS